MAALNHPNIVHLHSVEDADGLIFMTMELVQGRSLREILASTAPCASESGRLRGSKSPRPSRLLTRQEFCTET